jgi:hypothetical protein
MDVGEGREQGAEASRLDQSIPSSLFTGEGLSINGLQWASGLPFLRTPITWTYPEVFYCLGSATVSELSAEMPGFC